MSDLGLISLLIALALATYSVLASVLGQSRGISPLIESAYYATYLVTFCLIISSLCLVEAFLSKDFEVMYVFAHSNIAMPRMYTWVAIYAGNEGSLLFITTILSILSAVAIIFVPFRARPSLPYTNAILMSIIIFFLVVMATFAMGEALTIILKKNDPTKAAKQISLRL